MWYVWQPCSWLTLTSQLHNAHGHRTVENLSRYIPTLKGEELDTEVKRFEGRILEIAEHNRQKALSTGKEEGTIIAMPGAKQLLNQVRRP